MAMKFAPVKLCAMMLAVVMLDVVLACVGAVGAKVAMGGRSDVVVVADENPTPTEVTRPSDPEGAETKTPEPEKQEKPKVEDRTEPPSNELPPKGSPEKSPKAPAEAKPDLPTLMRSLRSKEIAERLSACEGLAMLGATARPALPPLVEALRDEDSTVRAGAKKALDRIGFLDESQLGLITTSLADKDAEVRRFALRSLARIECDDAKTLAAVVRLLEDRDAAIRQDAVACVGRFGETSRASVLPALLGALGDADLRPDVLQELKRLGPIEAADIAALLQGLKNDSDAVRLYSSRALGQLGPKAQKAVPQLVEGLNGAKGEVRHTMLLALLAIDVQAMGGKTAQIAALTDEEPGLRQRGAMFLAEAPKEGRDAVPALTANLKDKEPLARLAALMALEKIGVDAKVLPEIAKLLEDPEPNIRATAVLVVGTAGGESFVPNVVGTFADESADVKLNAVIAVGLLGKDAKEAVPELRRLLTSKDDKLRSAALWSLGKIGGNARAAVPDLITMLKDQDEGRRTPVVNALAGIGKRGVPPLVDALKSPDSWIRLGAVEALGKMGVEAKDAIGPLSGRFTRDPFPEIRAAAKQSLATIQAKDQEAFVYPKRPSQFRPKPTLLTVKTLEPLEVADKPMGKPKPEKPDDKAKPNPADKPREPLGALDGLITTLKSKNANERLAALQQIGKMKAEGKQAARAICDLIASSAGSEREAALESLEKIFPELYGPCVSLVVDKNLQVHYQALQKLQAMKAEGRPALPLVIADASGSLAGKRFFNASILLHTAAAIAPGDPDANRFLLDLARQRRVTSAEALHYLSDWSKDEPKFRRALVTFLEKELPSVTTERGRRDDAVVVIDAVAKLGGEGKQFLPLLRKLKLSETAEIRDAATRAVNQLEQP
jgi:HEAT repeat protein